MITHSAKEIGQQKEQLGLGVGGGWKVGRGSSAKFEKGRVGNIGGGGGSSYSRGISNHLLTM